MSVTFTVLIPITRPPVLLPLAVESLQRQTRQDWELFIICDGPPRETVEWAKSAAADDPRITVFDCPKGERNGEEHRHAALQQAKGTYVAHLADDNLWFPDHLELIEEVLRGADLGGTLFVAVLPSGWLMVREFLALTQSAYRLDSYRSLQVGWSPAPRAGPSDQFMFDKFRAQPDMREARLVRMSAVHLGADLRREISLDDRLVEMRRWHHRVQKPLWRVLLRCVSRIIYRVLPLPRRWIRLKVRVYRLLKRMNVPSRRLVRGDK